MSDDDLIRRGDALAVVQEWTYCCDAENAIAALPAVTVGVKPLDWQLCAGQDGVYYRAFDPLYNREVEAPNEATCDAIDQTRTARILAALEPVAAPDYRLAPHLQRIVDASKTAPQWDTEKDRLTLHRSFPEAGDGRPLPPMGDELMTAGLNAEDARFVAVQLAQNGWTLTPTAVDDSQTLDPAVNDPECTTCGGSGITYQTERRCACQPAPNLKRIGTGLYGTQPVAAPAEDEAAKNRHAYKVGFAVGKASAAPDPAAIREAALREAAATVQAGDTVQNIQRRILALIQKGTTK